MKSFAVRTGSTVVLVGSFAAIVYLGHVPLALMILGIQALMVRELLALAARARAGERAPAANGGSGNSSVGSGSSSGGKNAAAAAAAAAAAGSSSLPTTTGLGGSGLLGGVGGGWYFFCVAAFWIYLRFIHKQLEVEVGEAAATAALEEAAAYRLEAAESSSSSSSSALFLTPSMASLLLATLRARSASLAAWLLRRHTFVAFALYTLGWVSFVLRLERGCYLYQFRQYAWTHLILLLVFVPSSFFVSNIFDGIVWFLLPASLVVRRSFLKLFSHFFPNERSRKKNSFSSLPPSLSPSFSLINAGHQRYRCLRRGLLLRQDPADQAQPEKDLGGLRGRGRRNRFSVLVPGGCDVPLLLAHLPSHGPVDGSAQVRPGPHLRADDLPSL